MGLPFLAGISIILGGGLFFFVWKRFKFADFCYWKVLKTAFNKSIQKDPKLVVLTFAPPPKKRKVIWSSSFPDLPTQKKMLVLALLRPGMLYGPCLATWWFFADPPHLWGQHLKLLLSGVWIWRTRSLNVVSPRIWELFKQTIYGDVRNGLCLVLPH